MLRECTGAKCWRPDLEIAFLQIEKKKTNKWSVYPILLLDIIVHPTLLQKSEEAVQHLISAWVKWCLNAISF